MSDRGPLPRLARLAARDALPPSLMFVGPPGAPMLAAAIRLAAVVNSEEPEAAQTLEERIRAGMAPPTEGGPMPYPDVRVVRADGRQIRVDQIREAIAGARMRPFEGRRRFLILAGADSMHPSAANALLKTLEEPNPWLGLILTAHQPAALLPTIASRCQRWRFPPLTAAEVASRLREEHEFPEDLAWIATAAARANPDAARELPQERLAALQKEAEGLASVVGKGVPPAKRAALTDRFAKPSEAVALGRVLTLLGAVLRDLAALASGAPAESFPRRKELVPLAALAPPGAWAEAALHAGEARDRIDRFNGNRRMQLERLLLLFNDIARPLVIARRRKS